MRGSPPFRLRCSRAFQESIPRADFGRHCPSFTPRGSLGAPLTLPASPSLFSAPRLNPGGALNWKYAGEAAFRFSGLPYSIVRLTGLDGEEDPVQLEFGQGGAFSGSMSRKDAAVVAAAAVGEPAVRFA